MGEKQISKVAAYTLVNAGIESSENSDDVQKVLNNIRKVENVVGAHQIYGVYDVIAYVEAGNMEELKETVTWGIRRCDNVRSTLSMTIFLDKNGNPIGFKKDAKTGEITYENTPDCSEYRIPQ